MGNGLLAAALVVATLQQPQSGRDQSAAAMTCSAERQDVHCREDMTITSDVPDRSLSRSLASTTLSGDDLRAFGGDSQAWLDFALRASGAAVGQPRMFVDGMPAAGRVPPSSIARVDVNNDQFSVENTGVDQIRIDVDLKDQPRLWTFDSSIPPVNAGGASSLLHTRPPRAETVSAGLGGPVPHSPLTFSLHALRSTESHAPVFASASGQMVTDPAVSIDSSASILTAAVAYTTPRVRVRAQAETTSVGTSHAGIGGLVDARAGSALASADSQVQTSWRVTGQTWIERGGISWRANGLTTAADFSALSLVVTGESVGGGTPIARQTRSDVTWMMRDVLESAEGGGLWQVGVDAAGTRAHAVEDMNQFGRLQLRAADAPNGTWFITHGAASARVDTGSAAGFAQRVIIDTRRLLLRAGGRIDWDERDGVVAAPRASMRIAAPAGVIISGAFGVFTDAISPDLRLEVAERDAAGARTLMLRDVSLEAAESGVAPLSSGVPLTARFDSRFTRRRDIVWRAGAERRLRGVDVGVEFTSTRGIDLAGSRRQPAADALVDVVASDRRLARGETHVRAGRRWTRAAVAFHYEYARSFDDTDGAYSFPERSADLSREWGPSSTVPRHAVDVVASTHVRGSAYLAATLSARSGLPFSALTGADAEQLGTYTDRGGLARNSLTAPSTSTVSTYLYKSIGLRGWHGIRLDVGACGSNLLNATNAIAVGQVTGSPLFGRPLTAAPGRSIRVWMTASRD